MTREEILCELKRKKPDLQKRYPLRSMALFGSYVNGQNGSSSDVDILVDVDPSIGMDFVTLAEEIEAVLGIPVDLVSSRALKPRNLNFIKQHLIYV